MCKYILKNVLQVFFQMLYFDPVYQISRAVIKISPCDYSKPINSPGV